MDDQYLFAGLKSGERIAIKAIYKKYLPTVKSWIMENSGSLKDAEDIFQETLETILLKIDHIHTSLGGLILHIAKNKWYDRLRKDKRDQKVRKVEFERQAYELAIEEDLIEKEKAYLRFKLLEMTFLELSELCRKLMAYVKKGMESEKIISKLEFASANTMYRRKAACLQRWATLIKNDPNYKHLF